MAEISEIVYNYKHLYINNPRQIDDKIFELILHNHSYTDIEKKEAFEIFLDRDIRSDIKKREHRAILQLAISSRMKYFIDFLLLRNRKNKCILHYFIDDEYEKFNRQLDEADSITAYNFDIRKSENDAAEFLEWLASREIDFDDTDEEDRIPLELAIELNLQHVIPTLVKHTKKLDLVDYQKRTFLHLFLIKKDDDCGIDNNWYGERYNNTIISMLLVRGLSAEAKDVYIRTPIGIAISKKLNMNIITTLLKFLRCVNYKGKNGETLFHTVIRKWTEATAKDVPYYMAIARALIVKGADVNESDTFGLRPATHAIETYNADVIAFLWLNGADFTLITSFGETLMHEFITHGYYVKISAKTDEALFELLLDKVQVEELTNAKDETVFFALIKVWSKSKPIHNEKYERIARLLIAKGANVNRKNVNEATPAFCAIEARNLHVAEFLRDNGADFLVSVKGDSLAHLLLPAKFYWHNKNDTRIKLLDLVLKNATDVDLRNSRDETLFYSVVEYWSTCNSSEYEHWKSIALSLLGRGARVNEPNNFGRTPLARPIETHNLPVVKFLEEHGADFNVITNNGNNLLHLLAYQHKSRVIDKNGLALFKMVIRYRVNVNFRNDRYETPLLFMVNGYYNDLAKLLVKRGANVDARNHYGFTALHLAAVSYTSESNKRLINFLLEFGADFNARTPKGCTALQMSVWRNYTTNKSRCRFIKPRDIPPIIDTLHHRKTSELDLLLKHWVKLDVANLKGNSIDDYSDIYQLQRYNNIRNECLAEMEILQTSKDFPDTSLYQLLRTDVNQRRKVKRKCLSSFLNSKKRLQII
ncbi:putative ankyrin repeat protein RF_0381 [Phymastichus coffea]|uniref:putative ankyrin repeat protein RF_0381 n=1 Tax=Phymastichus coffea TaxID=108790 RepID=UPI00273BDEEB|nr:putative ankyrin repeat protein RF_0381 [Phymastichus coffea]